MRVEDLVGGDVEVYRAVAELDGEQLATPAGPRHTCRTSPHLQDIARSAGLSQEEAGQAVHRLSHTEPKILHAVAGTSGSDLGPSTTRPLASESALLHHCSRRDR
jgi:hypothetical protein